MKYEILKSDHVQIPFSGREVVKVRRIVALRDINNPFCGLIKEGTVGGYVESDANLDQTDESWIAGTAVVAGNAKVTGNSLVQWDAKVLGDASRITEVRDSILSHRALVKGGATLDKCNLEGSTQILGEVQAAGVFLRNSASIISVGKLQVLRSYLADISLIKADGKVEACILTDAGAIAGVGLTVTNYVLSGVAKLTKSACNGTLAVDPDLSVTRGTVAKGA